MTLRCIAIDDEPLALRQIVSYIQKTPFLELVRACADAQEAMEVLAVGTVDLMYVDINLPGLSGMDLVKSLAKRPLVVFTTAYSEYAVEGYKVDAQDYLLKPFGYGEFLASAQKSLIRAEQQLPAGAEKMRSPEDSIWVKSEYRTLRILLDQIVYVEGMKDYVRIHLTEGKAIMTLTSLKALEDILPSSRFMRVHRSWIVNAEKITLFEKGMVVLLGKHQIPIGDQFKESIQKLIHGKTL